MLLALALDAVLQGCVFGPTILAQMEFVTEHRGLGCVRSKYASL